MIKKLSSRFVLGLVASCSSFVSYGQFPANITTTYTTNPVANAVYFNGPKSQPQFGTFVVTNNNAFPVKITEVGNFHIGNNPGDPTLVQNGGTYILWAAPLAGIFAGQNSNSATPNIGVSLGWVQCGQSSKTITNTVNSIIPVITVVDPNNAWIGPGASRRFALSIDKVFLAGAGAGAPSTLPTPTTHTAAGTNVNLNTSGTWIGNLPGGTQSLQDGSGNRFAWTGYINIDKAAPRPPVLTQTTNNGKYAFVLCKDGCVTLTATADAYISSPVFHFYRPGGPEILQGPTDPPNARTLCGMTSDSNGSYVVTVTDGTMTSDPTITKVTVLDIKAPLVSGKQNYCLNESFNPVTVVGAAANSGDTFLYYYSATGGSPIPFVPYFNTTTAHEDDYFVSQTLLGCEGPRAPIKYTAAPKPNPPIVTTPIYYCENAPAVQLNANGQKPLNWYYQPAGGISSQIAPTPNTTKQDSFVYFVSQTVDGCEGDRSKIDVVVTFRPNGLIIPSRAEICQNDTLTLRYYGSAFPGSSYNWTFPSDATPAGDDSTPIIVQLDSPGRRTISLHVGVDGCYSPEYKQDIIVDAKPRANIVAADDLCQDQRTIVSLSTYTPTIDSFFWDFDNGVVANASTDQGPYGVTWATPGKKTIALRIVDGLCSFTEIDTPTVHPRPDATFSVTGLGSGSLLRKEPFCSDDSVLLTPNTVTSFSTYSWTPNRFFDVYSNVPVVYAHLDYQDTTSITLTVTDQYGCMNTEKKIIHTKACCEVLFPTAFSPNGDGTNDYFHPVTYGRQDIRTMKVMNRWGQTVYESGANFPNKGWDGKINGKDAEMGSYFYFINFKCAGKNVDQKGEVVLVR